MGGGQAFVGCGAYVEQNLVVTCRHVWRDAGEAAEAVFPHANPDGEAPLRPLELIHDCKGAGGKDPDIVLLRPVDPPRALVPLFVARADEHGKAFSLARIPSRDDLDDRIEGQVDSHVNAKGWRAFNGAGEKGYWFEYGSSGSPVFLDSVEQLAGIITRAEQGAEPQDALIRKAFVVPGKVIWPFVRAVSDRELGDRERAIQKAIQKDDQDGARELIFEIARRSGADASTTFEQALANARAAYDEGLKAIEAGGRGGNLGALVDDLLKKLAERTRLGDFAGGAADAYRAFTQWEKIEAERRETSLTAGLRILSEGARQDTLRRDFRAAAERYARIVELETADPSLRFRALRAKGDEFYVEGRAKGVSTSLEIAIELARLTVLAARDADERCAAGNDLAIALQTLGGRESGTARLEEAVAAYRAALEEMTRERVSLDWATSMGNQGVAMCVLAERTGELGMARQAAGQITVAATTLRAGGHAYFAAYLDNQRHIAGARVKKLGG